MAFDFAVIQNVNGFYSDHFLESLFDSDSEVKQIYEKWGDDVGSPPPKRLQSLRTAFFRAKGEAARCSREEDRFAETRSINRSIAEALGYETLANRGEKVMTSSGPAAIPVLARVDRDGDPYLFLIESSFKADEDDPILDRGVHKEATDLIQEALANTFRGSYEGAVEAIFRRDDPPRWVMILAGNEAILAERHKWTQGKWLRVDLDRMFDRGNDVYRQVAALASRETLCPQSDAVLHDGLDDRSHRHAFGVSEDLKHGLRLAVEVLANEYIYDRRNRRNLVTFDLDENSFAQLLKEECLRYLYRLLFLFFAEARAGELGIIPMNSDEYRLGYSLEHLRDLEQVPLETPEAQNGYFIHESLKQLFRLVNTGTLVQGALELENSMPIRGLQSPLFEEIKSTPELAKAKFRNRALQNVLELLSLSKAGNRRLGRGRISYSQLGINQLGAVYEGILSYSGFFAKEDLYEVRKPGDEDAPIFFISSSETGEYRPTEFVNEPDPTNPSMERRKMHPRGSYVFQLAGRDRQKSASYYTPEVLTKCVVERALKELLNPREGETLAADQVLGLCVLEPAMGSGAFLNEAINQLADHYLILKQKELGEDIPAQQVPQERQRVKAFIAANNVYGVDMNPIAAELAKVSLWLNALHEGAVTPWFGLRLAVGNSLIGCRREVWSRAQVSSGDFREKPPTHLPMGPEWTPLPKDAIYHFLLPDKGMVEVTDSVVKGLVPDETQVIKDWRREFISSKWEANRLEKLVELSILIDDLWRQVVEERRRAAQRCRLNIRVWGQPAQESATLIPAEQEVVAAELEEPFHAGPRLKLLMDYWCALWFWPVDRARELPSSHVWLFDVETILRGTTPKVPPQMLLSLESEGVDTEDERTFVKRHGYIDTAKMVREVVRFSVTAETAERHRFHHWELRFAELFADRGGFDLTVGNPPWVKLQWEEAGILSEAEPKFALRKLSAPEIAIARKTALNKPGIPPLYVAEWQSLVGSTSLYNAVQQYPLLKGGQTNLYKLFIEQTFRLQNPHGVVGLLHPEGVFDDTRGGALRQEIYQRLRLHAKFINELKLFSEIDHLVQFGIFVYGPHQSVSFQNLSNLYHPRTLQECESHDGFGPVPGIKTENNEWETRGHKNRLITVTERELAIFAQLLDGEDGVPAEARLPVVHSYEVLQVLRKLTVQPRRLGDIKDLYFTSQGWNETNSCNDGTIKRETRYPQHVQEWIISGPHFHVGTPLNKTPNFNCQSNGDYSSIDLTAIPPDYLPRTNYVPVVNRAEYERRMPTWNGKRYDEYYRLLFRNMLSVTGERSLIGTIACPSIMHINGIKGLAFDDPLKLCLVAGLSFGLITDFLIRSSGKANLLELTDLLPVPGEDSPIARPVIERVLELSCLTIPFGTLYEQVWKQLGERRQWSAEVALRSDRERRLGLVDLDVLGAIHLQIGIEELVGVYRSSFPVLQHTYERPNRYDANGRLVPSVILKAAQMMDADVRNPLPPTPLLAGGSVVPRSESSRSRRVATTTVNTDPTWVAIDHPTLGRVGAFEWEDPKMEPRMKRQYVPPFVGFNREDDMRAAFDKYAPLAEKP